MKAAFLAKQLFLLTVLFALFAFTSKMYKSNFSGDWKLNESKSELGQFDRFAVRTIKADQKDEAITIARTSPSFNGDDMTTSETLSYDGKETETTVFGNSKRKSTAKWSDDGKALTINYILLLDFNGQTTEIKGTEAWTLSDDGKNLTVQVNSSSPQGEFSWKAVYDKQ
jgi:hypothetical protein